ncbi:hypothetical protein BDV96DRAFT_654697 [Lophiotrema nucula]|uniref:Uncharacterized protein n=1 Tax=Lophiotrema nucula TaxID=690887 RepID=A0A6A5YHQ8_9PLEO|nr:hypothetical protein BDV96DRAFT_654697 [Lophiotrema nucula]
MPSFSGLPAELRQEIIKSAIIMPFSAPTSPEDVEEESRWYPLIERFPNHGLPVRIKAGDPELPVPMVCFNTKRPWVSAFTPLLLVSKSFKADADTILKNLAGKVHPILDVMADRDLTVTWLRVPIPDESRRFDTLEIDVRIFEPAITAQKYEMDQLNVSQLISVLGHPDDVKYYVLLHRLFIMITKLGLYPKAEDGAFTETSLPTSMSTFLTLPRCSRADCGLSQIQMHTNWYHRSAVRSFSNLT